MGLLKNILDRLNTRKYNKLKNMYINEFEKTGILPPVDEIQEYISDKNIFLISKNEKMNDKFDDIEEIFNGNDKILSKIMKSRKEIVLLAESHLESDLRGMSLDSKKPFILSQSFADLKNKAFNFDKHYNQGKSVNLELQNFDAVVQDAITLNNILRDISDTDINRREGISNTIYNLVNSYFLKKINSEEDFVKKEQYILEAKTALDEIKNTILEEKKPKYDIINFLKDSPSKSNQVFFERLEEIERLSKYGIEADLKDDRISFIDASDQTKIDEYYEKLETEKIESLDKKFSEKDFAMVRTTEYLPKNREMEIIDELNLRIHIPNFLSSKLTSDMMKEEYGDNYLDDMWNPQKENDVKYEKMMSDIESYSDQYGTLSTGYRSTKHFTLNGLVGSHAYGNFSGRPFIFIDPLEEHINDERLQSINEADTYFKISRENPFKLSQRAELMMPIEEYMKIKDDTEMMKEISQYKLTLFEGDEKTAVDMKLSKMGYIPETIGSWGYDIMGSDKFAHKIDKAVESLSNKTNIPVAVHYYSEVKNEDQERMNRMTDKSNNMFVEYIFEKFDIDEGLKKGAINQTLTEEQLDEILKKYGKENIVEAIKEFNDTREKQLDQKREEFETKRGQKLSLSNEQEERNI